MSIKEFFKGLADKVISIFLGFFLMILSGFLVLLKLLGVSPWLYWSWWSIALPAIIFVAIIFVGFIILIAMSQGVGFLEAFDKVYNIKRGIKNN